MQVLKPGPLELVNLLQHAHHVAAISSPCPSRPESEPHSPKPDASATRAPPYVVMHRAAMRPTATPAFMHVARDQDVDKIEDTHGSRLHRSTRPLVYTSPDRRQGCAQRHSRRTFLALLPLERPSPFSNATPRQVEPGSEVQGSQLAEPAARQTAPLRVGNRPPGVAAAKYHMCRRVLGTAGPKMSSPARLPSPELPNDPCSAAASCGGPKPC